MNKKTTLILLASLLSFSAMSQDKKKSSAKPTTTATNKVVSKSTKKSLAKSTTPATNKVVLKSTMDSVSYALGFNISQDLKARGFNNLNYDIINRAMIDAFRGNTGAVTTEQAQTLIMTALTKANQEKYAPILAEGQKYLDENKKKLGVTTLPSGLQYEVLQAGTGDKPKATDQVTVHYKGTLINGKQFDSSYDRNEPATFALNGVIPGWTEGLQLMPVGSKYRFAIPYQLGYGERGAGAGIPPYSVLLFDVELIKIGAK